MTNKILNTIVNKDLNLEDYSVVKMDVDYANKIYKKINFKSLPMEDDMFDYMLKFIKSIIKYSKEHILEFEFENVRLKYYEIIVDLKPYMIKNFCEAIEFLNNEGNKDISNFIFSVPFYKNDIITDISVVYE